MNSLQSLTSSIPKTFSAPFSSSDLRGHSKGTASSFLFSSHLNDQILKQTDQTSLSFSLNKSVQSKRLMQAAKDMESLLVKMLFKQMKQNTQKTGFLKGGFAEDIFDDFLTGEYAKQAVEQRNFNLARTIYNQLSRYL